MKVLDRWFRLSENHTTLRTEVMAGTTTFLTMAYIIFVQPTILSGAVGAEERHVYFGSVMVATCLSAAIATAIMALYARYPIVQAPGMGENFFFVFSVVPAAAALPEVAAGEATAWQVAMAVVLISGIVFLFISLVGVREAILNAVSPSMKNGIAAGIGLYIAFLGLQNAGVVLRGEVTAVRLNTDFKSPDMIVFFFGLLLTAILYVRRVRGSILWGILGATIFSMLLKEWLPGAAIAGTKMKDFAVAERVISAPPSLAPTFFNVNLRLGLSAAMLPFIVILLFMDVFDTIGTLIGVGERAGLVKNNKLERGNRAMVSDAVGTVAGACLGTSTVTSFIESAAGVEQGGRTGLTSLTSAALFLVALFFSPIVKMVGSYAPITAPALVAVGAMMIRGVKQIDWEDYSESLPAFLILLGIPLFHSISDGLAVGFIAYPLLKFFGGRLKEVQWLMYLLGIVLLLYFLFVRGLN